MLVSLLIFIIVLGLLILAHELGHFWVAKRAGIRVDEFGLGFPPRLWSFRFRETIYSLNWIPFGGFVRIYGEDPFDEQASAPGAYRSMATKPKLVQAAVLVAGVTFNLIFAWSLLSTGLIFGLPVDAANHDFFSAPLAEQRLIITSVLANSPAANAGILPGDQILSLAAETKTITPADADQATAFIRSKTAGLEVQIKRRLVAGEETHYFQVKPQTSPNGTPLIGVTLESVGILRLPWYLAPIDGLKLTWSLTKATVIGLGHFVTRAFVDRSVFDSVAGPIGLVSLVGDASKLGLVYLLSFMALISINLAVINLIPFPALDGGRLLFLAIETIKGSKLNPKFAGWANLIGFICLIGLLVVVSYFDVVKLL
jgi:regulator of sigma E protease